MLTFVKIGQVVLPNGSGDTGRQTDKQTNRKTYRQTDKKTDRQINTDKQTDRQIDKQTDRPRCRVDLALQAGSTENGPLRLL